MAAAKFYLERGLNVAISYPEKIVGMNKVDFNDVLKHLGTTSIERSLQNAVPQKSPETTTKTMGSNNIPATKTVHLNKELSL